MPDVSDDRTFPYLISYCLYWGEGWLGFPDLWSGQKLWWNWYLIPVANFQWTPEGPVSQIYSPHLHIGAPGIFSVLLMSIQTIKREWGAESNGKLPHLFIPPKTAALVPAFAVKDMFLGRTLMMMMMSLLLTLGHSLTNWLLKNSEVHCRNYISAPLIPIFSKVRSVPSLTTHLLQILLKFSFFRSSHWNSVCISGLFHMCYMFCPSQSSRFKIRYYVRWRI